MTAAASSAACHAKSRDAGSATAVLASLRTGGGGSFRLAFADRLATESCVAFAARSAGPAFRATLIEAAMNAIRRIRNLAEVGGDSQAQRHAATLKLCGRGDYLPRFGDRTLI